MAYRSAQHETTTQTPSRIIFGREMKLPQALLFCAAATSDWTTDHYILEKRMDDIHALVREKIRLASDRMKTRYDIRANASSFQQGEKV